MAAIPNVVRRGGTSHFRRMVPLSLRPLLGRAELVRTLGTGDTRTAKVRAFELYVHSEHLFLALCSHPMLTQDQFARLVQDFYAYVLDLENEVRLNGGYIPEEARGRRAA